MLGLVAGSGMVPVVFCQAVTRQDVQVATVDISPQPSLMLAQAAHQYCRLPLGSWQEIVRYFSDLRIKEVYFLGKVDKSEVFNLSRIDQSGLNVLARVESKGDQSLLQAFGEDLLSRGITIGDPSVWLQPLFFAAGVLTETHPTPSQKEDVNYGYTIAKALADLDIGQTVVVKDRAVIAVEAAEGTDRTLLRAGIAPGAVAVKVARSFQDMRYDVPVIGPETVKVMKKSEIKVLAFEAHKTYLIDPEKTLELADLYDLVILGVPGNWGADQT
jgi:DUF1009 family protein